MKNKNTKEAGKEKSREERIRELHEVIKEFSKKGKEDKVFILSDNKFWGKVDVVPTGILSLDLALAVGGVPVGRIVEIEGMAGAGKSSLALTTARAFQRNGGIVLYVDMEHALYRGSMEAFGLDPESTVVSQPLSGEEALDLIRVMVQRGVVDLVVLDSLASLTFQSELEKGTAENSSIGLLARKFSNFLRVIYPVMEEKGISMVVINQLRQDVSAGVNPRLGPKYISPGGMAKLFYSSVTIRAFRSSNSDYMEKMIEGKMSYGHTVRLQIEKNRFGIIPGFRTIYLDLIYGKGFDVHSDLVNLAINLGVASKSGSWYTIPGVLEKVQGKIELIRLLKENPEAFDKTRKAVIANFLQRLDSGDFPSNPEEDLDEVDGIEGLSETEGLEGSDDLFV